MYEQTNDTNKLRGQNTSVSQEEAKRICRKKKRKRKRVKKLLYFVRMWDERLSFNVQAGDRGVEGVGRSAIFLAFRGQVNPDVLNDQLWEGQKPDRKK